MVQQSDPAHEAAGRPGRPQMDRPPGPVSLAQIRPPSITRGVGMLRTAVAVGTIAVITAFIWRTEATTALVGQLESSGDGDWVRQQAANIVLFGSLGLMVLLMILELVIVAGVGKGRRLARVVLTLLVPLHVAVLFALHEAVVQETWYGTVILIGLVAQSVLSLLALVLLWMPTSSRWLREVGTNPVRTHRPMTD